MSFFFRRLRLAHLPVVALGCAFIVVMQKDREAQAAPEPIHSTGTASPSVPTVKLSGDALSAFQSQYRKGGYFGAFAVGADGAFGWTESYGTLAGARQGALAYCHRMGENCQIVSELVPDGETAHLAEFLVPFRYKDAYATYRDASGAKAFAMTENGAYGSAWGHTTIWAAKAAALRNCQAHQDMEHPDYMPGWPCQITEASWF